MAYPIAHREVHRPPTLGASLLGGVAASIFGDDEALGEGGGEDPLWEALCKELRSGGGQDTK